MSAHPDMGCAFLFPDMGVIEMAYTGPEQKGAKHGRTPNGEWTEVPNVPFDGPALPKKPRNKKWNENVTAWWDVIRVLPHCVLWDDADWQFAIETANYKELLWQEMADGKLPSTLATEIRRREDVMGTTREARRKLHIRYVDAAPATEDVDEPGVVEYQETAGGGGIGTVTPLKSRRARLTA